MRPRNLFLFLIFALIVSGCGSTEQALGRSDWCFTWDFREGLRGWTGYNPDENPNPLEPLPRYEHVPGIGVIPNDWGRLWLTYAYPVPIDVKDVSAKLVRPDEAVGTFNVEVDVNIFGIEHQGQYAWPDTMDEINLALSKNSLGSAYQYAYITVNAEQDIILESITVYGSGVNPFPINLCPDGTLTPPPTNSPTPSPTPTPTPEGTLTASATVSLTPTPSSGGGGWTCTFDFTLSNGGWYVPNPPNRGNGGYSATLGWVANESDGVSRAVNIARDLGATTTITDISMIYTASTIDTNEVARIFNYASPPTFTTLATVTTYNNSSVAWSGSISTQYIAAEVSIDFPSPYQGSGRITSIIVRGTGTNPITSGTGITCGDTPTSTPTGTLTPSNTPTGTLTPSQTFTPSSTAATPTRTTMPSTTPPPSTRTPIPNAPTAISTRTPDPLSSVTPYEYESETNAAGGAGEGLQGIANGLGNILGDWGQSASDLIGGMIDGFTNAPPEAIPGIPLCMSEPLEHDWCAIIYITEYTILAPGTVGELIIPLLQIMFYIFSVTYLARSILWLVRRAEEVTTVD